MNILDRWSNRPLNRTYYRTVFSIELFKVLDVDRHVDRLPVVETGEAYFRQYVLLTRRRYCMYESLYL